MPPRPGKMFNPEVEGKVRKLLTSIKGFDFSGAPRMTGENLYRFSYVVVDGSRWVALGEADIVIRIRDLFDAAAKAYKDRPARDIQSCESALDIMKDDMLNNVIDFYVKAFKKANPAGRDAVATPQSAAAFLSVITWIRRSENVDYNLLVTKDGRRPPPVIEIYDVEESRKRRRLANDEGGEAMSGPKKDAMIRDLEAKLDRSKRDADKASRRTEKAKAKAAKARRRLSRKIEVVEALENARSSDVMEICEAREQTQQLLQQRDDATTQRNEAQEETQKLRQQRDNAIRDEAYHAKIRAEDKFAEEMKRTMAAVAALDTVTADSKRASQDMADLRQANEDLKAHVDEARWAAYQRGYFIRLNPPERPFNYSQVGMRNEVGAFHEAGVLEGETSFRSGKHLDHERRI
ncbi:Uu.00g063900.m01.CDS01 [Anthostomella pinea]|uniref:Uu.00g063900.m01.CDS01 n=1 Tax=Anthostomella pinea TaxID=933095 RepID=A0AAI8VU30_9PEZI|nr:Uu.00g063900.m01.CDS01 [Anthostomella pinea]